MSDQYQTTESNLFPPSIQIIFITLAVISSLISLLIPILYYIRKKCTQHPTSLIAIISLLEALSNYNVILIAINIYQFEQFIKISNVFNILVFYDKDAFSEDQFCYFNFMIYIFLEMLSIAYNVCFSLDLLLTIKWPFFAGKKRMKYYHFFSLLIVIALIPLTFNESQEICDNQFHHRSIYKIPLIFFISLISFYLISFVILTYSCITPQNSEIRKKYIRHHRALLLALMVVWAFPISANALLLFVEGAEQTTAFGILNLAAFVSLLISGGFVNIVRFVNDKFLWLQVKKMVLQWKYFDQSQKVFDIEDEETGTLQKQKLADEQDVWNLPLANAVSSFHSQTVVTNIIQTIVETCEENQQLIFNSNYLKGDSFVENDRYNRAKRNKNSQITFENLGYEFNGPVVSPDEIREHLKFGTYDQIKRISKINKKCDMVAIEMREGEGEMDFQRNVFKSIDMYESYTNKIGSLSSKIENKNKQWLDLQIKKVKIKVKSYAHPIFTALRKVDGLTAEKISKTLDIGLNQENIKKARESLGASGSFFFFSSDNRLVIKTIPESQTDVFIKILPSYYEHIMRNPNSLICRTYGLYSVEIAGISQINFIMLENTFKDFADNQLKYTKYDLKGSTIKREVKNPNAEVFKDINFLNSDEAFLLLPKKTKQKLFRQIKADINVLCNHNIMDYSLLIGVSAKNLSKAEIFKRITVLKEQNEEISWRYFTDSHILPFNKLYSISIIDYLQEFNFNKYSELKLKQMFKGGGDISSIDTQAYYKRFLSFVNKILVPIE